jgi:phosphate uptake regulator
MKRRIVQHGPSTLTISLPSNWTKQFSLRKGDELSIEPLKSGLYITCGKTESSSKRISVKGMHHIINRAIAALYKAGYDEIIVEYEGTQELQKIHDNVNHSYIGLEIVDESKTQITIRKVSETSADEFRSIFRRIFHFLISTAEEGYQAAMDKDREAYERLIIRDMTINKLTDFCRRIVNKHGQTEYLHETALYHLIEQLEKIGDMYRDLNKHFLEYEPTDRVLEIYGQVNKLLKDYELLFFSFSLAKLNAFCAKHNQIKTLLHTKEKVKDHLAEYLLQNINRELHNLNGVTMILHL